MDKIFIRKVRLDRQQPALHSSPLSLELERDCPSSLLLVR
jgi:hypothetical protein